MNFLIKIVTWGRRFFASSEPNYNDWQRIEMLGVMMITLSLMALFLIRHSNDYIFGLSGICAGTLLSVISFRIGTRKGGPIPWGWISLGAMLAISGTLLAGPQSTLSGIFFLFLQVSAVLALFALGLANSNSAVSTCLRSGAIACSFVLLGTIAFQMIGVPTSFETCLSINVVLIGLSIFLSGKTRSLGPTKRN